VYKKALSIHIIALIRNEPFFDFSLITCNQLHETIKKHIFFTASAYVCV